MKTEFKTLARLIMITLFLTLIGCSEEVYQTKEHSHSENKNKITLSQFKNETKIKDFKTILKVTLSSSGMENRTAELSEFVIDTIAIQKHVSENNKTTYSFRIYTLVSNIQLDEKYNLVYTKENDIWEKSIIAFKERVGATSTENQLEDFVKLYDSRLNNTTMSSNTEVCISENYYIQCDGSCREMGWSDCDGFNCITGGCIRFIVTVDFCGGSGGGPSDPNGNDPTNPIGSGVAPLNPFEFTPNLFDNPVFDDPNYINAVKAQYFFSHLDYAGQVWANQNIESYNQIIQYQIDNNWSSQSNSFAIWAISYLDINASSPENISFINNLLYPENVVAGLENPLNFTHENIDYLLQNYFSIESITHVQNVLDEIIEESNNPSIIVNPDVVLVEAPQSTLINDMNDYLDCFDTNQNAIITLFVDQPTPNSNEAWSGNPTNPDVGHTFISIRQGNIRRVIGLYPSSAVSPTSPAITGAFYNDSGHHFDVSLGVVMNPSQLNDVLNYIKGQVGGKYNLNSNNCTDFGLAIIRLAGIKMPSAHGNWGVGAGDNPGQLGQNIRNMPTPTGGLKNTTGGTGLSNIGGC